MSEQTDEQIWQQVLAGNSRAYELVWRRHHERVFRHHLRAGTPPSEAEDLTAVTFLELWRRRSAVRFVDSSLLPWLIVTAHNTARNASRARRRYQRFLSSLPPPPVVSDHAESVVGREDGRMGAIWAGLAGARPVDAHLLIMTVVEGFTVREAATVLGLSESAAKMRLSRLRRGVREAAPNNPLTEGGA